LYFTSHGDAGLARAVSEGRRNEYAELMVSGEFIDPQGLEAFERSKISWNLAADERHAGILDLYRELIGLRKRWPCLHNGRKDLTRVEMDPHAKWLRMHRADPSGSQATLLCNFSDTGMEPYLDPARLALSTSPQPGAPLSACLFLPNP
jgi:1,4-alpha-glucan branching enzyme